MYPTPPSSRDASRRANQPQHHYQSPSKPSPRHMFTTPKKGAARFRAHPYASPMANRFRSRDPPTPFLSPGGPPDTPSDAPSSPLTSRFKTPTPHKRIFLAADNPFTPSPIRVSGGVRRTPSQTKYRQHVPSSPIQPSAFPVHLQSDPTFASLSDEAKAMAHHMRLPPTNVDTIVLTEIQRLAESRQRATALAKSADAQETAKASPPVTASTGARSRHHQTKEGGRAFGANSPARGSPRKPPKDAKGKEGHAKQERVATPAARDKNLCPEKERYAKREQEDVEIQFDNQIPDPPIITPQRATPDEPMQTDVSLEEAQRLAREKDKLAAERHSYEEDLRRFLAEKETREREADLEAARRHQERLEQERLWAERDVEYRQAERERLQHDRERIRVWQQEQESLRQTQQAALDAQLAAEKKAQALEEQYNIAQAKLRQQAEEQEARLRADQAAFERATAALEAQRRAEEQAQRERYFQQEQEQQQEYFYWQQYWQQQQQQEQQRQQQQQQQQQTFTGAPNHRSHREDTSMRERSSYFDMDASMHSVTDDTPYADSPPRNASPPPPPPPPPPSPPPPQPTTDVERFALYERKWEALLTRVFSSLTLGDVPWPVLVNVSCLADITPQRIKQFICGSTRPGVAGKGIKAVVKPEILRYHPDKFGKIIPMVCADQQAVVEEAMQEVARVLILIRDGKY